jgi:molecular chaperone GrpE
LIGDKHDRHEDRERSPGAQAQGTPPSPEKKEAVNAADAAQAAPGADAAAGGEAPGEIPATAEERLAALEAEHQDLKDKYLRKYADFENYKKRITKEREESARYSNAALLLDVVGIIDDFERAIKSAEDGKDFKKFHAGISMIEKQLVSILEKKWGLERFAAKGRPFDPERHEALMAEQSAQATTATVVEDLQSGYVLHGRVLRPAKVKVLQPLPDTNSGPENGDNNDNAKGSEGA